MPTITPEYPEGQRSIEMMLVEMLTEKISWNDRKRIASALCAVRNHACEMQSEQKDLKGNISGSESAG